jgi:hypothetical protein
MNCVYVNLVKGVQFWTWCKLNFSSRDSAGLCWLRMMCFQKTGANDVSWSSEAISDADNHNIFNWQSEIDDETKKLKPACFKKKLKKYLLEKYLEWSCGILLNIGTIALFIKNQYCFEYAYVYICIYIYMYMCHVCVCVYIYVYWYVCIFKFSIYVWISLK